MTHGLRSQRVQHDNHAPAKYRTQINMLFSDKYLPAIKIGISTLRTAAHAIGVQSNTAC
jgi:hypothetical protein